MHSQPHNCRTRNNLNHISICLLYTYTLFSSQTQRINMLTPLAYTWQAPLRPANTLAETSTAIVAACHMLGSCRHAQAAYFFIFSPCSPSLSPALWAASPTASLASPSFSCATRIWVLVVHGRHSTTLVLWIKSHAFCWHWAGWLQLASSFQHSALLEAQRNP
jgi:hypothetical protein